VEENFLAIRRGSGCDTVAVLREFLETACGKLYIIAFKDMFINAKMISRLKKKSGNLKAKKTTSNFIVQIYGYEIINTIYLNLYLIMVIERLRNFYTIFI
jgi:hypothetical protein